ncbi:MAG: acyl-CoA dehydrogenase, partial [Rhodospirillaceae bacterium]|nr:acyl-CoA dehydrogenase [Rhodospirillaceae bacterium]
RARKFAAGYMGITVPSDYGGRGGAWIEDIIYNQEEAKFVTPRQVASSLGLIIPTILAYASEEQKKFHVGGILRGEQIWCQLFSEPSAGSDLAGLRTRSRRDGDDWVINGQKIWTSGAHQADYGILMTRSDPNAEKHKGLTYFFVDMKTPGIEVRPIKQISGVSNFNEVFFTDARIPDSNRFGREGEGWKVAITTLMNERVVAGERPPPDFEDIFALSRQLEIETGPAIGNSAIREKLATWYIQTQGVRLTRMRSITALSRGREPGPENSIGKAVSAYKRQEISAFGMDLMDMAGVLTNPDMAPMRALFQDALMESPSSRIAAGTDEILRNVIGERVLGLPREIRVDKGVPFSDLVNSET